MDRPSLATQLTIIRNLRAVRDVRIRTTRLGVPHLHLQLNEQVMRSPVGDTFLLPALEFDFTLRDDRDNGFSNPVKGIAPEFEGNLHPHIRSIACWGHAQEPLREAYARQDWVTFVHVVIMWAATYNWRTPYVALNPQNFNLTDKLPGWVSNEA